MKEGHLLLVQEDEEGQWCPEIHKLPEAGTSDKELIDRIGNKYKHASTLEHLNYSFDIDGISRACLQELARHRHASLSVKSTRYTLKELKEESIDEIESWWDRYCVGTSDIDINSMVRDSLRNLKKVVDTGASNDVTKYCLPEAYRTSLVWTVNARSLQNFLTLRSDKSALWEIRDLAHNIFEEIPEEHKYLFRDFIKPKV
jgi:thymidylate synthase (FAD)